MLFKQFQHEEGSCLSYVLGCTRTGVAAVIEPQLDIQPYLRYLSDRSLKLTHIFETHAQADHLSGAKNLARATGASVYYHESARPNFPVHRVKDGDMVMVGNIRLNVLYTPGHTDDSICLVVTDTTRGNEPWFVLTGDTLLVGDVGRPDLHGSAEALYESLHGKLLRLPDSVEVYPTHFAGSVCGKALSPKPSSTIGFERRFNLPLQLATKEEFVNFVMSDLPVQPPRFEQVRKFNLGFLSVPPIEKTYDQRDLQMTVHELKAKMERKEDVFLLDVREPNEYAYVNLGGYLIPLRQIPHRLAELDPNREIVVYCHTGSRSARAVEYLYEKGFSNVKNLVGGIDAWSRAIDPSLPRY